jgi:hypothetical protein
MSYTELLSAYFSKGEPVNDLTKTLIFDSWSKLEGKEHNSPFSDCYLNSLSRSWRMN